MVEDVGTLAIHSPLRSYIPHVAMIDSVTVATDSPMTRSPVNGLTPPFASVAAITAMSSAVTRIEH